MLKYVDVVSNTRIILVSWFSKYPSPLLKSVFVYTTKAVGHNQHLSTVMSENDTGNCQ